jgi:hypothetical protein
VTNCFNNEETGSCLPACLTTQGLRSQRGAVFTRRGKRLAQTSSICLWRHPTRWPSQRQRARSSASSVRQPRWHYHGVFPRAGAVSLFPGRFWPFSDAVVGMFAFCLCCVCAVCLCCVVLCCVVLCCVVLCCVVLCCVVLFRRTFIPDGQGQYHGRT